MKDRSLLRLWFSLSTPVRQPAYAVTGFGLALVKYVAEAGLILHFTGQKLLPLDFLNPLLSVRQQFFEPPAPSWLQTAILIGTLPFLWISVSMSVRRAVDAGQKARLGLFVMVPLVNYFVMLVLCVLPTRDRQAAESEQTEVSLDRQMHSALLGVAVSVVLCLGMVWLSIYWLENYGASLFMGTPFLMGVISASLYNRPHRRGLLRSVSVAALSVVIAGLAILLFALEGVICLAMLFPVAVVMATMGGLLGYSLALLSQSRHSELWIAVVSLPLLAGAETLHRPAPVYEVVSSVEIDASPEEVWPFVVGFSELPPPAPWYFRLGIAYPLRATIEGEGVGAVRHCEFSTGAFVEPITAWEPGRRLAFDVAEQPPPMHELSPYRHVHPPHLDGYLRCLRGEFRLVGLPGGRTRLVGRTWYEFEMYPQDYWTLWSDGCIHRIHERVLRHIKSLAESAAE